MEHISAFCASELSSATFIYKSHSFNGLSANTKDYINTHKIVWKTGVLYSCFLSVATAPDTLHLSFIVCSPNLQTLTILKYSYVLNNSKGFLVNQVELREISLPALLLSFSNRNHYTSAPRYSLVILVEGQFLINP